MSSWDNAHLGKAATRMRVPTLLQGTRPDEVRLVISLLPASGGPRVKIAHESSWWADGAEASHLGKYCWPGWSVLC